jgi:PAS domain-containing protein
LPLGQTADLSHSDSCAENPSFRPNAEYALALLGDEQARAIEILQAQARGYRIALDAAPHGICIFDASGRVVFSNSRFADLYRLPTSEALIGAVLAEVVSQQIAAGSAPTTPETWIAQAKRVLVRRAPEASEVSLVDGRFIHVGDYPTPDGGSGSRTSTIVSSSPMT